MFPMGLFCLIGQHVAVVAEHLGCNFDQLTGVVLPKTPTPAPACAVELAEVSARRADLVAVLAVARLRIVRSQVALASLLQPVGDAGAEPGRMEEADAGLALDQAEALQLLQVVLIRKPRCTAANADVHQVEKGALARGKRQHYLRKTVHVCPLRLKRRQRGNGLFELRGLGV